MAEELYLWNGEVSSAFWAPLSLVEVCLRNTISQAFIENKSDRWCLEEQDWIAPREVSRINAALMQVKGAGIVKPTVDHVVNETSFGLWSGFLGPGIARHKSFDYETRTWQLFLHRSFGGDKKVHRKQVHELADDIRKFRNQVAHHSPIFHRNLKGVLNEMTNFGYLMHAEVGKVIADTEKVTALLRQRPDR